jgi:hypothetical protein
MPDKLSCSLDLATGTGKSYVIYGIARILLKEAFEAYPDSEQSFPCG